MVWAMAGWGAAVSWMAPVSPSAYAGVLLLLLPTAVVMGGALYRLASVPSPWRWGLAPLVVAGWEALRISSGNGFAWATLSSVFADTPLVNAAGAIGASGLTVAASSIGASVWALLQRQYAAAAVLAGAGAALLLPGVMLPPPAGAPARVAAVQTWMTVQEKFAPEKLPSVLDDLRNLAAQAADRGARLVVLPEGAIPADPFRDRVAQDGLSRIARDAEAWVVAGAIAKGSRGRPANLALLVAPDGKLHGAYAKVRRVPFGEPILARGPGYRSLPWGRTSLGAVISWEIQSSAPFRRYVADGVAMTVSPSSTAFAPSRALGAQQVALASLRAAESGRPLALASNGISAIVDGAGRVLAKGTHGRTEVLVATARLGVGFRPGPFADRFLSLLALAALGGVWLLALLEPSWGPPSRRRVFPAVGWVLGAGGGALAAGGLVWSGLRGMPLLGLPHPAVLVAAALAGGAVAALAYGPLWTALALRWGDGLAWGLTMAALWLAAGLMPPEGMLWLRLASVWAGTARAITGAAAGPAVGFALAAAVALMVSPAP